MNGQNNGKVMQMDYDLDMAMDQSYEKLKAQVVGGFTAADLENAKATNGGIAA